MSPPQEPESERPLAHGTDASVNDERPSPWNSLERAKLVVSVVTAIAVVWLGYGLTQRAQTEAAETARETAIIQKRMELWDQLGPKLSRINVIINSDRIVTGPEDVPWLRREREECEDLLWAYAIYFPNSFNERVDTYLRSLDPILVKLGRGERRGEDRNRLRARYEDVLEEARSVLGLPTD